jgi:hypothetical protein
MLYDTVTSICYRNGRNLTNLAAELEVSRPTLMKWLRMDRAKWSAHILTDRFYEVTGKNLFDLMEGKGDQPSPALPPLVARRLASNKAELARCKPNSLRQVVYLYLLAEGLSLVELENRVGAYRHQIYQAVQGKVRLTDEIYKKLCALSDSFLLHWPWRTIKPKGDHEARARRIVNLDIINRKDFERQYKTCRSLDEKEALLTKLEK